MNDATPRALIVDDDRSFQHGLAEVVEREGFKALTAGDLAEARAELAQGLPDAVLIDLNFPDGSGMELLDEFAGNGSPEVMASTDRDCNAAGMSGGGISMSFTSSNVMPTFFNSRYKISFWFA